MFRFVTRPGHVGPLSRRRSGDRGRRDACDEGRRSSERAPRGEVDAEREQRRHGQRDGDDQRDSQGTHEFTVAGELQGPSKVKVKKR